MSNREQQYDMSICSLCGIEQIESIILKLRNYDTIIMINVNDDNDETKREQDKPEEDNDDIDKLIGMVMNDKGFDLKCPNRNDNQPCPAMVKPNLYKPMERILLIIQSRLI